MTNEELLSVAEIVDRLATRFHEQAADHERKLVEHRAAFGARTEADAKIIAGMRAERDGLLTQVQDMRAEIESLARECKAWELSTSEAWTNATANMLSVVFPEGRNIPENTALTNYQLFRTSMVDVAEEISRLHTERDGLRAEVAALQERLRASIARGDFAQMEVAALKSQTPKHPVKVGEYVTWCGSPGVLGGTIKQVAEIRGDRAYRFTDGGVWSFALCEPCAPPIVKREPEVGDTVRLVMIPSRDDVSPELRKVLEWPWIERWGTLNQTALAVEPAYQLDGALSVCLSTNVYVRWPLSCVEVVTEATHGTEAGKAAAEAAVKTEPVADEIKARDLIEMFQKTSSETLADDVSIRGTVSNIFWSGTGAKCVRLIPETMNRRSRGDDYFSYCDVRKVTT